MPSRGIGLSAPTAPPREAIAFALAIVRSTPPGTTAEDYALKLRDHLKRGQLNLSGTEQRRYIDLVGYLQERLGEVERHNRELQSTVINFERLSWISVQVDANDTSSVPTKRKRPASPSKQSIRAKAAQKNPASAEETMEADFDLLEGLGPDGTALMEKIWTLQKLLRRPDADPEAVCSSLVGLAKSIGCVLSRIAMCYDRLAARTLERPSIATLAHDKSEFSCAITACVRAFGMVYVGLERLNDDSPGQRLPGLVIYECVNMFSTALDAIETSARQSAGSTAKKNVKTKSKSDVIQESLSARGIAQFLRTLIGMLQKNKLLHQKLFDGFAFILFERVGKLLYYTVFGCHRSVTNEGNIAPLPKGHSDKARQEMESLAVRLEVKALVLILERVMDRAPNHLNPQAMNNRPAHRSLSFKTLERSRAGLSLMAKDRLQRTLVACMFGDKVEDSLRDTLTMPVPLGPLPSFPKVTDKTVEEWYQDRVWELVGWDIMARETEWMNCSRT